MINNTTKICGKCGIEKEFNMFSKMTASKDGRQHRCKECQRVVKQERKLTHHTAISEYNHSYYSTHKKEHMEYSKQYLIDNPEKGAMYARNQHARRKGWENPQPINKPFKNSHMHHTHLNSDHQACIYIPAELHNSIRHAWNNPEKMAAINKLAFEWLATCDVI